MTGSRVTIEFIVQDHNAARAARAVERALRATIEHFMKRGRLRHVVGSPVIRTAKNEEE